MDPVHYLLTLVVVVTVHATRGDEIQPTLTNLHDVQEYIQRALSESDEKHAAQIASLRKDNENIIQQVKEDNKHHLQQMKEENEHHLQQVKDELSKKHTDDMHVLKIGLETQIRELLSLLEADGQTAEEQENDTDIDRPMHGNAEQLESISGETLNTTARPVYKKTGVVSPNATRRYRNSRSPIEMVRTSSSSFQSDRKSEPTPLDRMSRSSSELHKHYSEHQRDEGYVHSRLDRQVSGQPRVAFYATMEVSNLHLGQNDDIVFEHVFTNIGNAYNNHHGIFIAPVNGVYVFSCTLMNWGNLKTYAHFMVNGAIVAKFNLSHGEDDPQTSQTIIVSLLQGHDVSVQNTDVDRIITGDKYSTFSGFLLFEDPIDGPLVG